MPGLPCSMSPSANDPTLPLPGYVSCRNGKERDGESFGQSCLLQATRILSRASSWLATWKCLFWKIYGRPPLSGHLFCPSKSTKETRCVMSVSLEAPWMSEELRRCVEPGAKSQCVLANVIKRVAEKFWSLGTVLYLRISQSLHNAWPRLHSAHRSTPPPRKILPILQCTNQDWFVLHPGATPLFSSYMTKSPGEDYRSRLRSKPPHSVALPSQAHSRRPDLHILSGAPPSRPSFSMSFVLPFPFVCPLVVGQNVAQHPRSR